MTDWLSGGFDDDANAGGGEDFGSASYLDLDSPPPPDAAPMPPAPPADSGGYLGGEGEYAAMDPFAAAPTGDPYASAPAAGAEFGYEQGGVATAVAPEPEPSYFSHAPEPQQYAAPAMQAAPTSNALAVEAPYLEEVHPGQAVGGLRGATSEISELVLDVEVQVEVCFGDAALTVEEFLEMGRGSVVELDHAIDAPIELKVKGRLVARGQLVSINGNYGMRITEMSTGGTH
jgi:flagellar motor switch protein FliN